jgi:hypothetical protein
VARARATEGEVPWDHGTIRQGSCGFTSGLNELLHGPAVAFLVTPHAVAMRERSRACGGGSERNGVAFSTYKQGLQAIAQIDVSGAAAARAASGSDGTLVTLQAPSVLRG